MNFNTLREISHAISMHDKEKVIYLIDKALQGEQGKHWQRDLPKLRDFILDGAPRFTVFKKDGNSKLPFLAFSSLPGSGHCPGAGECLNFCYSFRAWRYPSAFCRQAQNSWLMYSVDGWNTIARELDRFEPATGVIDFRLYVDGDFKDVANARQWFHMLKNRQWLNAYGYSKSWAELLQYSKFNDFPDNYTLNLSSGSVHGDDIKQAMKSLPITRGEFVAVSVGYKVKSTMHNDRLHQRELRKVYGKKAFTCPGKCNSCTVKGHACGSERFKGLDIIIAVH